MAYELFLDGFDYYNSISDITKKWQSYTSYVTISPGLGRRGGNCLGIFDSYGNFGFRSKPFTPSTHVVFGFAFKLPNNYSGFYLDFYSQSGLQFRSSLIGGTNVISAGRFGIPADKISTKGVSYDAWTYFECGLHLSDTGSYEIRVNGNPIPWISNNNYDTCVNSGELITNIMLLSGLGGGSFQTGYFDDFYITYGDEIKFLGDCRIDTLTLTANSTPQDWVPDTGNAWERLNQETGYISANTANAISMFAINNITHNPTTIHGIQINGHALKSDAGYKSVALLANTASNTYVGNTQVLATDVQLIKQTHIKNPATGLAWNKEDINNLEVGIKVIE